MSLPAMQLLKRIVSGRPGCGCETCPLVLPAKRRRVMLVGSPNVGKSVVFNQLTGRYAVVSNYPGTTVEVTRGQARIGDLMLDLADTPGAYSLAPYSEDERVTQRMLMDDPPDLVVHVTDARNLRRLLPLTLQLVEAGIPLLLDVNIIDEAERAGLTVDQAQLSRELGIPVVATAAAAGVGVDELRAALAGPLPAGTGFRVPYPEQLEQAVSQMSEHLNGTKGIGPRALALLLLQRDQGAWERVRALAPAAEADIERIVAEAERQFRDPLSYAIAIARQREADRVADRAIARVARPVRRSARELIGALAMHPMAGIPILIAVLYFGLYLGVGRLGAGFLVDFLDKQLFGQTINPALTTFANRLIPWTTVSALLVGEYGVLTLGVRYAFAIVLPLVAIFFLIFAVLEDSGYLPRLAMLVDRLFKRIGLSGRAVIPLVLGLGCDTMATLVTRVLETRRERIIATFLLALAIPCSAQLGVILGLLSAHPLALGIWAGVVGGVFLLSGFLAAKLLPGEAARFYIEIPPMRWPSARNIVTKTLARLRWYAVEVIPVFLLASVLIWLGELTHLFQLALGVLRPLVGAIGLPGATADAFLFGFFRRDYGAARIFDVHSEGAISGIPLVVAMVTITLFIPCIAQFLVMVKERGIRAALAVAAIILPFAFGVGYLLNAALLALKVQL
ncbi:MAG: ferrous iron transport protein B [Armatimonadota bacterium]